MTVNTEIKRFILIRFFALAVFLVYYVLPTEVKPSFSTSKKKSTQDLVGILTNGASGVQTHDELNHKSKGSSRLPKGKASKTKTIKHGYRRQNQDVNGLEHVAVDRIDPEIGGIDPDGFEGDNDGVESLVFAAEEDDEGETVNILTIIFNEASDAIKSVLPDSKYFVMVLLVLSVVVTSVQRARVAATYLSEYSATKNTNGKIKNKASSKSTSQKRRPRDKASARKALIEKIKARTGSIESQTGYNSSSSRSPDTGVIDQLSLLQAAESKMLEAAGLVVPFMREGVGPAEEENIKSANKKQQDKNKKEKKKTGAKGRKARETGKAGGKNQNGAGNTTKRRHRKRVTESSSGKKGNERPRAFSQSSGSTSVSVNDESYSRAIPCNNDEISEAKKTSIKDEQQQQSISTPGPRRVSRKKKKNSRVKRDAEIPSPDVESIKIKSTNINVGQQDKVQDLPTLDRVGEAPRNGALFSRRKSFQNDSTFDDLLQQFKDEEKQRKQKDPGSLNVKTEKASVNKKKDKKAKKEPGGKRKEPVVNFEDEDVVEVNEEKFDMEKQDKIKLENLLSEVTEGELRELVARRMLLVEKDKNKLLSFNDIINHQKFMKKLCDSLQDKKEQISKTHKITGALLRSATDSRKRASLNEKLAGLKRAEAKFNRQVTEFNKEKDWFESTSTFKQSQDLVAQNWRKTASGVYISEAELQEDAELSFEEVLQQTKLEFSNHK